MRNRTEQKLVILVAVDLGERFYQRAASRCVCEAKRVNDYTLHSESTIQREQLFLLEEEI